MLYNLFLCSVQDFAPQWRRLSHFQCICRGIVGCVEAFVFSGDDHSGPSLDVYGPLLAEMPRPIICSAVLVDSSARLVWLDRSVMRVVDRRRPRIYSDAQKHRTVSLLLVFNLEMETASTDLEFRVDSYYITHLCLTFSFLWDPRVYWSFQGYAASQTLTHTRTRLQ